MITRITSLLVYYHTQLNNDFLLSVSELASCKLRFTQCLIELLLFVELKDCSSSIDLSTKVN